MKTIDQLAELWNAQADEFNQWPALGLDEMIEFAQKVERDGTRAWHSAQSSRMTEDCTQTPDTAMIERLAREAGAAKLIADQECPDEFVFEAPHLAKFAALVAEECAKVCEDVGPREGFDETRICWVRRSYSG